MGIGDSRQLGGGSSPVAREGPGRRLWDAAGMLPTPGSYPIANVSRVHVLGSQASRERSKPQHSSAQMKPFKRKFN